MKEFLHKLPPIGYLVIGHVVGFGIALSGKSGDNSLLLIGSGLASVAFAYFSAIIDVKVLIHGIHWKRAIYRTVYFLGVAVGFLLYAGRPIISEIHLWEWLSFPFPSGSVLSFALFLACCFGIPFDPFYNKIRRLPWNYKGTQAGYDIFSKGIRFNLIFVEVAVLLGTVLWFLTVN